MYSAGKNLHRLFRTSSYCRFNTIYVRGMRNTKTVKETRSNASNPAKPSRDFSLLVGPTMLTATVAGGTYWLQLNHAPSISERFVEKVKKFGRTDIKIYEDPRMWWDTRTNTEKLVYMIIAANIGVYLAWNSGMVQPMFMKYMVSSVYGPAPSASMLGSMFSHMSLLHVGANMFVLNSLVKSISLSPEEFLHIYLSGGLVAALASYSRAVLLRTPTTSLGASGALLAVLGWVMTKNPETRWSIVGISEIFPHSFTSTQAFYSLVIFDCLGLLMGWRMLDHAAHLGGIMFGALKAKIEQNSVKKT